MFIHKRDGRRDKHCCNINIINRGVCNDESNIVNCLNRHSDVVDRDQHFFDVISHFHDEHDEHDDRGPGPGAWAGPPGER